MQVGGKPASANSEQTGSNILYMIGSASTNKAPAAMLNADWYLIKVVHIFIGFLIIYL